MLILNTHGRMQVEMQMNISKHHMLILNPSDTWIDEDKVMNFKTPYVDIKLIYSSYNPKLSLFQNTIC